MPTNATGLPFDDIRACSPSMPGAGRGRRRGGAGARRQS